MHVNEGLDLVLLKSCRVQHLADEEFNYYRMLLSGLTEANAVEVAAELKRLHVLPVPGGSSTSQTTGEKRPASLHIESPPAKCLRESKAVAMNLLVELVAQPSSGFELLTELMVPDQVPDKVCAVQDAAKSVRAKLGEKTDWVRDVEDVRLVFKWDSEQYVA